MTEPNHSHPVAAGTADDDDAARRELHERRLADARPINRAAVFAALAAAGIDCVTVRFDGYGDRGQIENVEAKSGPAIRELPSMQVEWTAPVWGKSEPERSRITLCDAIETVVYACLEETHMGWPDNDGAYGAFTFDVATRTVTLDYNERYTSSDHTRHVFQGGGDGT